MKSMEMIGVFYENNTEHTRVHTLLGEKQSFLTLQPVEHVVATGLHTVTTQALTYLDPHAVICSAFLWTAQL